MGRLCRRDTPIPAFPREAGEGVGGRRRVVHTDDINKGTFTIKEREWCFQVNSVSMVGKVTTATRVSAVMRPAMRAASPPRRVARM